MKSDSPEIEKLLNEHHRLIGKIYQLCGKALFGKPPRMTIAKIRVKPTKRRKS